MVAEKTAKNFRGPLFLLHPVGYALCGLKNSSKRDHVYQILADENPKLSL